jgi:hypothetical protein
MKYLKFAYRQNIVFYAKRGAKVHSSLKEAQDFCIKNDLKYCTLIYDGFTFDVTPTSSVFYLALEFKQWKRSKSQSIKNNPK